MKAMPKLLELDDMEEFGEFFKDDNAQDAETQLRFAYALGQPGFKYTLTHHDLLQSSKIMELNIETNESK